MWSVTFRVGSVDLKLGDFKGGEDCGFQCLFSFRGQDHMAATTTGSTLLFYCDKERTRTSPITAGLRQIVHITMFTKCW